MSVAPYPGGTDVVAGQRVALRWSDAYNPVGYGPVTNAAPNRVAQVPPMLAAVGIGTADSGSNVNAAAAAASSPWDWALSPVPWAIVFIVGGLLLLRFIHWRPVRG
jgi:hypothetical protein